MNIFALHIEPKTCAAMHCDKHVVKMILESAQMICTTHHLYPNEYVDYDIPYKLAYVNHPCTKWVRHSLSNYKWLMSLTKYLNDEYVYRYDKVVNHKSWDAIYNLPLPDIEDKGLTKFAQAMPDDCKNDDSIVAYLDYYRKHKSNLLTYTKRMPPACFPVAILKIDGKEMNAYNVSTSFKGEKVMTY